MDDGWTVSTGGKRQRGRKAGQPASGPAVAAVPAGPTAAPLGAGCGLMPRGGGDPEPVGVPGWSQGGGELSSRPSRQGRRKGKHRELTAEERTAQLLERVHDARREVAASSVLSSVSAAMEAAEGRVPGWRWDGVKAMVVYGLGPLGTSPSSRAQLAMALLLAGRLPGLLGKPEVFDPAFTPEDIAVLEELGFEVLEANEGGAREVGEPTLFYMPHCEGDLYDALLGANWSPAGLAGICILGNSFQSYVDRWSLATAQQTASRPERVLAAAAHTEEFPVDSRGFAVVSAFNESSLHLFSESRVRVAGVCKG